MGPDPDDQIIKMVGRHLKLPQVHLLVHVLRLLDPVAFLVLPLSSK